MTDKTTNDLAIAVRDDLRRHRHMADVTRRPADQLVALMRQQLRHIPEADVAAVLLYAGQWLRTAAPAMRRDGKLTDAKTVDYTAAVVAIAGEEIHSSIQRRQAPSIKTGG